MNDEFIIGLPATLNSVAEAAPLARFDAKKYLGEIEEFDLTAEVAEELLRTVWDIISTFVRMGWDLNLCGKLIETFASAAGELSDGVNSSEMRVVDGASESGEDE